MHRGRLRYKTMSYGLKSIQDIFQKRMDQTFERCEGAILIADDIQVFGTDDIHDTHLHEMIEWVRSPGIKLNFDKCVIKSKSCTFFGNVYIAQGVKPDPRKLRPSRRWKHPRQSKIYNPFLAWLTIQVNTSRTWLNSQQVSGYCLEKIFYFSGQRAMKPASKSWKTVSAVMHVWCLLTFQASNFAGRCIQVRSRGISLTGRQPWKAETSSICIQ